MARKSRGLYERMRLRPAQMRTVADRRFADADCLRKTGLNARANGAMYLGGFVIECFLKAKLLEKYKWLQSSPGDLGKWSKDERALHALCYQQHDLAGLLDRLPEVKRRLVPLRVWQPLEKICATWTVFVRYSPQTTSMADAEEFLAVVKEAKKWLN